MTIINLTRGTTIARRVDMAASFWSRAKGLIGRTGSPPATALVLQPCISVHALFLTFPLDVIHLDRNDRVLQVVRLQPWHIGPIVRRSRTVIELPAGTAARTGTVVGDLIAWREPGDESAGGEHPAIDLR